MKDQFIGIRIDKDLKEKLEAAAKEDNRSLGGYIKNQLIKSLSRMAEKPKG